MIVTLKPADNILLETSLRKMTSFMKNGNLQHALQLLSGIQHLIPAPLSRQLRGMISHLDKPLKEDTTGKTVLPSLLLVAKLINEVIHSYFPAYALVEPGYSQNSLFDMMIGRNPLSNKFMMESLPKMQFHDSLKACVLVLKKFPDPYEHLSIICVLVNFLTSYFFSFQTVSKELELELIEAFSFFLNKYEDPKEGKIATSKLIKVINNFLKELKRQDEEKKPIYNTINIITTNKYRSKVKDGIKSHREIVTSVLERMVDLLQVDTPSLLFRPIYNLQNPGEPIRRADLFYGCTVALCTLPINMLCENLESNTDRLLGAEREIFFQLIDWDSSKLSKPFAAYVKRELIRHLKTSNRELDIDLSSFTDFMRSLKSCLKKIMTLKKLSIDLMFKNGIPAQFIAFFQENLFCFQDIVTCLHEYKSWVISANQQKKKKMMFLRNFEIFAIFADWGKLEREFNKSEDLIQFLERQVDEFMKSIPQNEALKLPYQQLLANPIMKQKQAAIRTRVQVMEQETIILAGLLTVPLAECQRLIQYFDLENLRVGNVNQLDEEDYLLLLENSPVVFPSGEIFNIMEYHSSEDIGKFVYRCTKNETDFQALQNKLAQKSSKKKPLFLSQPQIEHTKVLMAVRKCVITTFNDSLLEEINEILSRLQRPAESAGPGDGSRAREPKLENKEAVAVLPRTEPAVPLSPDFIQRQFVEVFSLLKQQVKHRGSREALMNGENHLNNLLLLMRRVPASKEQVFAMMVNSVAEASLVIEQILLAINLECRPVRASDNIRDRLTHNSEELLESNEWVLDLLDTSDFQMIFGMNRGEIESRDIVLHSNDTTNFSYARNLLNFFFRWAYADSRREEAVLRGEQFYRSVCLLAFKMCVSFATRRFKAPLPRESIQSVRSALDHFHLEVRPFEERPRIREGEELRETIEAFAKQDTENFCRLAFQNILQNYLPRLLCEVEQNKTIRPDEIHLHYTTILQISRLMTEEVVESILVIRGRWLENYRTIREALVAAEIPLETLSPFLEVLNREKVRTIARYHAQFESVRGEDDKKVHRDVKASRRVAKKKKGGTAAAASAASSDDEGFTVVKGAAAVEFEDLKRKAWEEFITLNQLFKELYRLS